MKMMYHIVVKPFFRNNTRTESEFFISGESMIYSKDNNMCAYDRHAVEDPAEAYIFWKEK